MLRTLLTMLRTMQTHANWCLSTHWDKAALACPEQFQPATAHRVDMACPEQRPKGGRNPTWARIWSRSKTHVVRPTFELVKDTHTPSAAMHCSDIDTPQRNPARAHFSDWSRTLSTGRHASGEAHFRVCQRRSCSDFKTHILNGIKPIYDSSSIIAKDACTTQAHSKQEVLQGLEQLETLSKSLDS